MDLMIFIDVDADLRLLKHLERGIKERPQGYPFRDESIPLNGQTDA